MERQSSGGRTVITPHVAKNRVITKFQQAFHPDATPYQKMNFDARVKEACASNKTGTVGYVEREPYPCCRGLTACSVNVGGEKSFMISLW